MKRIPWTFVFPFDNGSETSVTGYTPLPEKGVDYNTPADQESIVQQVIAALGTPVFGRVDADKNIILTAKNLAAGTYQLWFEDEEGAHSKICDYTHGGTAYVNQIPISTAADGSVYNTTGYKNGYRLNTSAAETAAAGMGSTGFIPCNPNDVLYFSGIATKGGNSVGWYKLQFFDANKNSMGHSFFHNDNGTAQCIDNDANLAAGYIEKDGNGYLTKVKLAVYDSSNGTGLYVNSGTINANFRYVRVVCGCMCSLSVVTINEPIYKESTYIPLRWALGKIDSGTGAVDFTTNNWVHSDMFPIDSSKTYKFTLSDCNGYTYACYYDASGNFLSVSENILDVGNSGVNGTGSCTIGTITNAAYFRLRVGVYWYGNSYDESFAFLGNGAKLVLNK